MYEEVRIAVGGGAGTGLNRLGPSRGDVLHQLEPDDVPLGELGSVPESLSGAEPVPGPESMPHAVSWALVAEVVLALRWGQCILQCRELCQHGRSRKHRHLNQFGTIQRPRGYQQFLLL